MTMKNTIALFVLAGVCAVAIAQHQHGTGEKPSAILLSGMGDHHRTVSTKNAEAQKFFDQGLTLIYAFNHDEAIRSFRRAAEIDPEMAMAHWGMAYALGPNINLDVDIEREKAAYEAVQKAMTVAGSSPENERIYIEALSKRYSNDPKADLKKLAVEFKDAMKALVSRYPDDLDAAVLYADSLMNLRPWKLWTAEGKPEEGTEEVVSVLESVIKRDPTHPGANHLYVHAVEASLNPERALPSAERLRSLVPAAGHLVHMPAHIFVRTGDFQNAAIQNEEAIKADEGYFNESGNRQGFYPMMYYNHNIHFLYYARSMEGRFSDAKKAADQVVSNALPHVKEMPMLDGFTPTGIFVLLRFKKWEDVLKLSIPGEGMPVTTTLWHYGRGVALARTGNIEQAKTEQTEFMKSSKMIPADALVGLNQASTIMKVAEALLNAEIATAQKSPDAFEWLRKAIEAEDAVSYDEPPGWYYPVRETYGAVLLQSGKAVEAEQIFRKDLQKNPRNGRSLYGLMESLKAQGKTSDAGWVKQQFDEAWKNADTPLRIEDL